MESCPLLRRPHDRMGHPRTLARAMELAMILRVRRGLMEFFTRHEVRVVLIVETVGAAG